MRLSNEIQKVLRDPDVTQRFDAIGFETGGGSADDFARFIKSEMQIPAALRDELWPWTARSSTTSTASKARSPRARPPNLRITRADGGLLEVPVLCRLDSQEEIAYVRAGGLLPMMCEHLVRAA